jgi:hypothetical protein
MNIFIDTEFTDLFDPVLISIGMVADSGAEFYAEVPYPEPQCTAFVREAVLPLLGRISGAYCSVFELRVNILTWLETVRRKDEEVHICADCRTDIDLFYDALDYRVPAWLCGALIGSSIDSRLSVEFFKQKGLPQHHALYDARANKYACGPDGPAINMLMRIDFG